MLAVRVREDLGFGASRSLGSGAGADAVAGVSIFGGDSRVGGVEGRGEIKIKLGCVNSLTEKFKVTFKQKDQRKLFFCHRNKYVYTRTTLIPLFCF